LAEAAGLHSVAFPAISTGVYRFPPGRAAEIAVGTVAAFLKTAASVERVVFCCFGGESAALHRAALDALNG